MTPPPDDPTHRDHDGFACQLRSMVTAVQHAAATTLGVNALALALPSHPVTPEIAAIGLRSTRVRTLDRTIERVLRAHPLIWPDAVVVRFSELAASSLNVEVMAWFRTSDWSAFQRIRQDVLLQFMDVVEEAGTSFAFLTTTVHLAEARVIP